MKKINIKLTLSLVSLFIAVLFIVLGNKTKVCLSFGLVFMAAAMELFALYRNDVANNSIQIINENMMADNFNIAFEKEYKKERGKLSRQKNSAMIMFSLCAICLIVLAITNLF